MEDGMDLPCLGDFKFICDRGKDLYYGKGTFSFRCKLQVCYQSL